MKNVAAIHHRSATHWVGNGFHVRSIFDYDGLGRELSPFLLLDYGAPTVFAPGRERRGVGAHPHRGFETVTIAYQGEIEHRDSSGGGGKIGAGDVQWMTAGAGIVHEEFHSEAFTRSGGTMQMAQLWVNLPARHKSAPAAYQTLLASQIPTATLPGDAGQVRVIAGHFRDQDGVARTFTPIDLWDLRVRGGHEVELPLHEAKTSTLLVLAGTVTINGTRDASEGNLVVFARAGRDALVSAKSDTTLLVMAGEPIDEPIVGYGPFVMNTRVEIEQAFADFSEGRMGSID